MVKRIVSGVVAIILWVLFGLFGLGLLIEHVYMKYFGATSIYFITSNLSWLPIVCSVVFFAVCIWLFSSNGLFGNLWRGEEGIKARYSGRTKFVIVAATLFITIMGTIASVFWFERYTLEGVECYRFGQKKAYTWEDVNSFTLEGDSHGILVFRLEMTDGEKYSFNGGLLHAIEYSSDGYDEQFPEGEYDYTVWLSKELGKRDVPMKVEDWEVLKDDLTYDSWDDLAECIREAYEEGKEEK